MVYLNVFKIYIWLWRFGKFTHTKLRTINISIIVNIFKSYLHFCLLEFISIFLALWWNIHCLKEKQRNRKHILFSAKWRAINWRWVGGIVDLLFTFVLYIRMFLYIFCFSCSNIHTYFNDMCKCIQLQHIWLVFMFFF